MTPKETLQEEWLAHSTFKKTPISITFVTFQQDKVILTFIIYHFSGYMAPEYASKGNFSIKSDVFSFGVVILEILSGKRNSGTQQCGGFINLLGYVRLYTQTLSLQNYLLLLIFYTT